MLLFINAGLSSYGPLLGAQAETEQWVARSQLVRTVPEWTDTLSLPLSIPLPLSSSMSVSLGFFHCFSLPLSLSFALLTTLCLSPSLTCLFFTLSLTHSLCDVLKVSIFLNVFILVRVALDPDPIPRTVWGGSTARMGQHKHSGHDTNIHT